LSQAPTLAHSARRIAPLAWPVFVGQVSVLAFSTVDTVLVGRYSALDLAALAVGLASYVTVFIGFMGVVLAVGPIVGQLYGAKRFAEAGNELHQSVWIALALSIVGGLLLAFPYPFLALSQASAEVAPKVRGYLLALAFSLPAALLFSAYRGFNTAVSRPKAVMALQICALLVKIPLSVLLVYGLVLPTPVGELRVPSLGVVGCGVATCVAMWLQVVAAAVVLRLDKFYAPFELRAHGLRAPQRRSLHAQLKLGVPMGLSILIEVTGFSFMAIFIARLGTTPVAGHQIAANLVVLLFMMPLGIANATSTLVAQRIGAGDALDARRLGWHGIGIGVAIATLLGSTVYFSREAVIALYTNDASVAAAALPLVAWVALFHTADAAQSIAAFVLRAYRIATMPLLIYAVAIWGVGLGGGYVLAFDVFGLTPPALLGARGFWFAATLGLVCAAIGLCALLTSVLRERRIIDAKDAPREAA
jgi:MATE family multidrug resistance protein